MNFFYIRVVFALVVGSAFSTALQASEDFGYKITSNVVYGSGKITKDGSVLERDLLMDVYAPSDQSQDKQYPAVVLVHGGAFHRGGLRQPPYTEAGAVHSTMQDYAKLLAPLGYVCFVIEYRLVPEHPVPNLKPSSKGLLPYESAISDSGLARTNFARGRMGLAPLAKQDKVLLWNGLLAAAEDLDTAILTIVDSAEEYGIDPTRIAAGGHSAGGTTVLNAAYGIGSPLKAIFPMSPAVTGFDFKDAIDSPQLPPMLVLMSQFDLAVVLEGVPSLLKIADKAKLQHNLVWVPGFPHFYPHGAVTLGDDGKRVSVGERIVEFLDLHLSQ